MQIRSKTYLQLISLRRSFRGSIALRRNRAGAAFGNIGSRSPSGWTGIAWSLDKQASHRDRLYGPVRLAARLSFLPIPRPTSDERIYWRLQIIGEEFRLRCERPPVSAWSPADRPVTGPQTPGPGAFQRRRRFGVLAPWAYLPFPQHHWSGTSVIAACWSRQQAGRRKPLRKSSGASCEISVQLIPMEVCNALIRAKCDTRV